MRPNPAATLKFAGYAQMADRRAKPNDAKFLFIQGIRPFAELLFHNLNGLPCRRWNEGAR
jgi:hypothetical protein